jgi:hypothetical protein
VERKGHLGVVVVGVPVAFFDVGVFVCQVSLVSAFMRPFICSGAKGVGGGHQLFLCHCSFMILWGGKGNVIWRK